MKRNVLSKTALFAVTLGLTTGLTVNKLAMADINVGVVLSLTGPAASLGIPSGNTVKLWPKTIAGQKVNLTVLSDNSDTSETAKQVSKLISDEKVDVIVGPSLTPNSLTAVEIAARNSTPIITLGGGNIIVEPMDDKKKWAFKMAAPENLSVSKIVEHMLANKVKNVAVVAVTTSYGEGFLKSFQTAARVKGINIVATERYAAQDLNTTPQALRIMSANPDAVFIMSFGTPGATPQLELAQRGYKGLTYQTHGVANADYLRIGGQAVEGTFMAVAPVLVAEQLPASNATKKSGIEYVKKYEAVNGPNTRSLFGSTAWTALIWLEKAVPVALKKGKPGTPEFKAALRDALEEMKEVVTPEGVFNMSPTNHNGLDDRAQVLIQVKNGTWKYVE
jgi:branched-chain amino acid transport system substrate-binding protein